MALFDKKTSGDPFGIQAAEWNHLSDMYDRFRNGPPTTPGVGQDRYGVVVARMRNFADGPLERFAVVGIDSAIINPQINEAEFLRQPAFDGIIPIDPDHIGKWAIVLEPLNELEIGAACVSGVIPVRVKVPDPNNIEPNVEIIDGEHVLENVANGSGQILWIEDIEEEERWALVRFPRTGGCGGLSKTISVVIDPDTCDTCDLIFEEGCLVDTDPC